MKAVDSSVVIAAFASWLQSLEHRAAPTYEAVGASVEQLTS